MEVLNDNIELHLDHLEAKDLDSFKAEPFDIQLKIPNSSFDAIFALKIKRRMNPFIMKYYLPSIGIVFISEMSFLINTEQLPARVAVLVTSFLILSNTITREQVIIDRDLKLSCLIKYEFYIESF